MRRIRKIYKYEIPGGQYSNLLPQVKEMGAGENFEEIKQLYKEANMLLGNIVKVTPSSKLSVTLRFSCLKTAECGKYLYGRP